MADEVQFRPMTAADVDAVAELHRVYLDNTFVGRLGTKFLRLFYSQSLKLNEIAVVATWRGSVVAYMMGTGHPAGFFSGILRRKPLHFALAAAPGLLKESSVILTKLRAFRRLTDSPAPPGTGTVLFGAVAVSAAGRGTVMSEGMMEVFKSEAARRGVFRLDGHTDKQNARWGLHLRRLGWRPVREFVNADGMERIEWEYLIQSPSELVAPSANA